MSSYFDDASLVMIPSGYKDQKVYSVKPTDGTGDLTFSRASSATRVASNGLIEKVRTNLLSYSNDFSNAAWTKVGGTTLTAGQADYLGGTNAWKWEATGTGTIQLAQNPPSVIIRTSSIYAKAGSVSTISLWVGSAVNFNLSTGTVTSGTGVITSVGNGWYRCSAFGTGISHNPYFASATAGDYVLISFAQLEEGDIATDYIATTTAAVSVGPVSGLPRLDYLGSTCPRLLLEPQRTNFATYSEAFSNWGPSAGTITSNATTSPDGYANADLFTEDTTTGYHRIFNSCTGATGTTKTYSVYAKWAGGTGRKYLTIDNGPVSYFDLENGVLGNVGASCTTSITAVGNGWYRCVVTHTNSLSGTVYIGSSNTNGGAGNHLGNGQPAFYIWGAQAEVGAYATSYIPTLGASVTRVADAASKTGISSLIGQTEGTIFVEGIIIGDDATKSNLFAALEKTSSGATMRIFNSATSNTIIGDVFNGSTFSAQMSGPVIPVGQTFKAALAYKENDFALAVNGVIVATDNSGTVPTTDDFKINTSQYGNLDAGVRQAQALLFKTRLTNVQLAELTA